MMNQFAVCRIHRMLEQMEQILLLGTIEDLISSGSGHGDTPSSIKLLSRGLGWKFSSQRYAVEGDGQLNTLISDDTIIVPKNVRESFNGPF